MTTDYSQYGLTFQGGTPGDEYGNGYAPEGYVDKSGNFFTPAQADSLISAALRGQMGSQQAMFVDPNKFKDDPASTVAALTRAQWTDYQQRYAPLENQLMQLTTYTPEGRAALQNNIAKATADADAAFTSAAGAQQRNFARYGMAPTADQQAVMNRVNGMARTAAEVDAANTTTRTQIDTNRSIAIGGIPNAGRAYGMQYTNQ